MAFLEDPRFPDDIAYGSKVTPNYNTRLIDFSGGQSQAIRRWQEPLVEFNVAYGMKQQAHMYELLEFFHAVAGSANTFRIQNPLDFRSGNDQVHGGSFSPLDELLGIGDGIETEFQLIKIYTKGAFTNTKTIKKPVSGRVRVALAGVEQLSGWTVDATTGIITFDVPVPITENVTAGFEYDTPARFADDRMPLSMESYEIQDLDITVSEVRV